MTKIFLSLFLIVIINRTFATENKWCDVDCHNNIPGSHALCHYSPTTVSNTCGTVIQSGLTQAEKSQIVNAHNSKRQKVASGQESRGNPGPQPAAKNMPDLEWDDQLAEIAQAWANQCTFEHICSHLSSDFSDQVGQNLAKSYGPNAAATPYEELVDTWYNEVGLFDKNQVKDYVFSLQTGHYSQVVWAKTTKVGCGGMKYNENGVENAYLVCNYSPAGNYAHQSVYETDE